MQVETIQKMSKSELIEQIAQYNEQLKNFGWDSDIGRLLYECRSYGHRYEERYFLDGLKKSILPTPINCLAVITHENPYFIIKLIHKHKYEQFLQLVCKVSMCLEVAVIMGFVTEIPNK